MDEQRVRGGRKTDNQQPRAQTRECNLSGE